MSRYQSDTHRKHPESSARRWAAVFIGIALVGAAIWLIDNRCSGSENRTSEKITAKPRNGFSLDVALPESMTSEIVEYEGFTVSFNKDNHTPNFCIWELTRDETDGPVSRQTRFMTDNNVEGCATTDDYVRSGYDRGHIVPAADQKWSEQAMEDCFNLTNICPQANRLNTGAWKTLEQWERKLAVNDSVIYIVAGPIYSPSDQERIGETGVRVPSEFFKVIVAPEADPPRGIAFVYPNRHCPGNMRDYSCTIDRLEEMTGYDFFPDMSPELEKQIESVTSFKEWETALRKRK